MTTPTSKNPRRWRIRLPKTRFSRFMVYLICFFLIAVAVDLALVQYNRRITISYDTTRITAPLKPDGTPDYIAALDQYASEGITADNNAAPAILQILGPHGIYEGTRDRVLARLKMPPFPPDGVYFESFTTWLSHHPGYPQPHGYDDYADHLDMFISSRIILKDAPEVGLYLEDQQQFFDALIPATRRPRYYIPQFPGNTGPDGLVIDMRMPNMNELRALGHACAAAALLRFERNDMPGAIAYLDAVHRFARLMGQGQSVFEYIYAIFTDASAASSEASMANSGKLSRQQALAMEARIAALPALRTAADCFDRSERLGGLDFFVHGAKNGLPWLLADPNLKMLLGNDSENASERNQIASTHWQLGFCPVDFNSLLRDTNTYWDRYLAVMALPTFNRRESALRAIDDDEFAELSGESWEVSALGHPVLARPRAKLKELLLFSIGRIPVIYDMQTQRLQMTQLAFALAAYHADHQAYPDTLDVLAPDYIPAVPQDLFIEKPLHYHRIAPDGYILYSLGPNRKDDAPNMKMPMDKIIIQTP